MGNSLSPCDACREPTRARFARTVDASPTILDAKACSLARDQGVTIPVHDVPITRVEERIHVCHKCSYSVFLMTEDFKRTRAQAIVEQWRAAMPKCGLCECPQPWRLPHCPGTQTEHVLQSPADDRTVSVQLD